MAGLTLWLLRHARVPAAEGRCHGQTDWAADSQATREAARQFEAVLPAQPTPMWFSPLTRCVQLAHELKLDHLLPQGPDARLAEMDFGDWEGREWHTLTPDDFAPWMADFGRYRVGGRGENVQAFMGRVHSALQDCRLWCSSQGHNQALWVTHAGVARAVQLACKGVTTVDDASQWPVDAPGCGQWQCWVLPGPQRS